MQESEGWGQAAAKATATTSEGSEKISTRYEEAAAENPSKCTVISVRRKIEADKNVWDRGSSDGKGRSGRAVSEQREKMMRIMMNRNLTASGADLAADKAARNRGRGRGGRSRPSP